ncbi:MAG: hypothetical protein BMS9Abin29_1375 [Gemmatimonadota bacterium]|nr:MAG: hypothetical protein BMS9Abin29_1375 [Gemmatimonadota bacterium]
MPRFRWITTACFATLAVVPSPAHSLQEYAPGDVAEVGTIRGAITFRGEVPAARMVKITADPEVCGVEPRFTSDLLVTDESYGVKNVVIWLSDIQEGKGWEPTAEPRTLNQKGCTFIPRVLVVPAGERFFAVNSDGILHNLHTRGGENRPINKAQPGFLERLPLKLRYPDIVRVECDAHDWMIAWIVVAAHPYYAVTESDGSFRLENVPPGTFTMQVWHERLGTLTREVTVLADAEVSVDIEYPAGP